MGTFGDFGNLGFVATWGLARFCGPCPVGMGGPEGNIRGFRKLRIRSHLGLGPFLRPLPGRWGQGRGGPESEDLDTLSYPSRGRDFNLNLVHDVLDRLLSAMPNAQQRRKIFASATMKPGAEVAVAWAATLLGTEDITIVLTE